jgi:hypothetical protein
MRRIYHTIYFEVHDEKALHEFVRKHADPEEFSDMEQFDAREAEGEPVDHVCSETATRSTPKASSMPAERQAKATRRTNWTRNDHDVRRGPETGPYRLHRRVFWLRQTRAARCGRQSRVVLTLRPWCQVSREAIPRGDGG